MFEVLTKKDSKASGQEGHPAEAGTDAITDIAALPGDIAENMVGMFKLFADETRLRIVYFLLQCDELNVRTLCDLLDQSQPAVSHHLALLRVDGLIECRRDGKHNFYRIVPERIQELVEMLFSVSPKQPGRISFETFSLSYKPIEQQA